MLFYRASGYLMNAAQQRSIVQLNMVKNHQQTAALMMKWAQNSSLF